MRPLLAPCLPPATARAIPLARQKIAKRTWISLNSIKSKHCTEIGIVTRWRTFRASTIESASITYEQNRLAEANRSSDATTNDDPPTQTMLAFRSLSQQPHNLDNLSRFEVRFDRECHRAAYRLLRLKEKIRKPSRESADNKEIAQ